MSDKAPPYPKCQMSVPVKPEVDPFIMSRPKPRMCARRAEVLILVSYSSVRYGPPGHDRVPLCADCWREAQPRGLAPFGERGYRECHVVNRLRGTVSSVSEVPMSEWTPLSPARLAAEMTFKPAIKRMMGQVNARGITPEDWRELMTEAVDEFLIESVLKS